MNQLGWLLRECEARFDLSHGRFCLFWEPGWAPYFGEVEEFRRAMNMFCDYHYDEVRDHDQWYRFVSGDLVAFGRHFSDDPVAQYVVYFNTDLRGLAQ